MSADEDRRKAFNRERFAHAALFRKKSARRLSRGAQNLGQELAQHYRLNEGGACVMSLRELGLAMEVHTGSVRNYRSELRDAGFITIEEKPGQESRVYMRFPAEQELEDYFRKKAEAKARRRAGRAATPTKKQAQPIQKTVAVKANRPLQDSRSDPYNPMALYPILSTSAAGAGRTLHGADRCASIGVPESYVRSSGSNEGALPPRDDDPPPPSQADINDFDPDDDLLASSPPSDDVHDAIEEGVSCPPPDASSQLVSQKSPLPVEVSPKVYDEFLDQLIAQAAARSEATNGLRYKKSKGVVVDQGDRKIYVRGR